ncbi:MAG: 6-phosphofructokinase [Selenomonadales bacterium]|nr:6-phosphofructokinase [Selenomonadales bacterium]
MRNIAVLTGGGDCPGLNAVLRAVVRTAISRGVSVWGVKNGFGGLVKNEMMFLGMSDVAGILPRGGTILGTTNRDNPFHFKVEEEDGTVAYKDMSSVVLENIKKREIDALLVIGGDGTIKIGGEIAKLGVHVVCVPKTIDNDIACTERTFGFDTAVGVATEALDRLHTTAESHHRVMVLEVMGRYAGWIALHAGLAGGADCILIPEIPYDIRAVQEKITRRAKKGSKFSLVVVAEGAAPIGGEMVGVERDAGSTEKLRLGGIGNILAEQLEQLCGAEARCTTLGHLQRGGSPTAYDRVLATRFGVAATEALLRGETDCMVALRGDQIIRVAIDEVAKGDAGVPVSGELVRTAKAVGISFGD